jgi:hypothetical protein
VINSGEATWDPPRPRKPGPLLAIVALVLVVVGTVAGLLELNEALGTRYAPKAMSCNDIDLGPLSTLASDAKPAVAPDELIKGDCRIQFVRDDGTPMAFGTVTVQYGDSRLDARIAYASFDAQEWTAVDGVGEEARRLSGPGSCSVQVVVRDVNAVVTIKLSGAEDAQMCAPGADMPTAMTAAVKGTLAKL